MTLSATELSALRSAVEGTMPDTAYILTATNTSDGQGGVTTSWGTTGTSICRLDVKEGRELKSGGAIEPFIRLMLSVPYDTTVVQSNRVKVGSTTYAVKSVNTGQSWQVVGRVELEQL